MTAGLLLVLASAPAELFAQGAPGAPSITWYVPKTLAPRVRQVFPPAYPAIAWLARARQVVILRVRVTPDGRFDAPAIVVGHPMLDHAALDALATFQLEPFAANDPAFVPESWVAFSFDATLPIARLEALAAVDEAVKQCVMHADSPTPAMAVTSCGRAQTQLRIVPEPFRRTLDRRARLAQGKAFIAASQPKDAIEVLQPVLRPPAIGLDRGAAFRFVAQSQAALGLLQEASSSCSRARDEYAAAREQTKSGTSLHDQRTALLRTVALECADFLEKAGKSKDAADARQRAADLK